MSPNSDPESPEEFEFSGWLSFYSLNTRVKGDISKQNSLDNVKNILQNKLPSYEQGRPDTPGDGFRIENTPGLIHEMGILNEYPFLDSLLHIEYIEENYQKMMTYNEELDDFIEEDIVDIVTSDIFWVYPQYMLIRASKSESKKAHSRLRSILVNSLRIEKLSYDTDFIIWLLYKNYNDESIDGEINLRNLQAIELYGESDSFGRQNKFSGLQESSTIALLPLIEGKTPKSIEAVFSYYGHDLVIDIQKDRIQVRSSKGSTRDLSDLESIAISISFISKLNSVYDYWDTLDSSEKYPPISFFKDIYQEAIESGYESKGISQELIERYRRYRKDW